MKNRERIILTIFLELYLKIPKEYYVTWNYGLTDKSISECIKKLIDENVFTFEEMSKEIKERYEYKIYPSQLKRYSKNNFEQIFFVRMKEQVKQSD